MAVKIALAGNPNCGKTTLFNALTGSSQFTGNWPGVTVEKKEGRLKGHRDVIITDLPGIYSLSPYTLEEIVAENYLITERPDVIINIVDGTNIERNLYLTTQLLELGIPVIVAVNMADILEKTGDQIHTDRLGAHLGCQVTEISALKGTGIQSVADQAVALAGKKRPAVCVHEFSPEAERIIKSAAEKLGPEVSKEQRRFFAIRLLEKDQQISQRLSVVPDVSDEIKALEEAFDDDVESIITNERYQYLSTVTSVCCTKSKKEKLSVSDRIDRIVTNRWCVWRWMESGWSGSSRCSGVCGRSVTDNGLRGLAAWTDCGRYRGRCGRCAGICTADAGAVYVPGVSGRLRLYGPCRIYYGPDFPQIRFIW